MKRYIIFIILFLAFNDIYGQNQISSNITVLAGGSAPFYFNSYTKMNDGMEYTDWTRLSISYSDVLIADGSLTVPTSYWRLLVRATTAGIPGDGAAPLNIDKVELEVSLITDDGTISNDAVAYFTLAAGPTNTTIVSNGHNPTGRDGPLVTDRRDTDVLISYRIGRNGAAPSANTILGEAAGYYYVDLIFTLEKGP